MTIHIIASNRKSISWDVPGIPSAGYIIMQESSDLTQCPCVPFHPTGTGQTCWADSAHTSSWMRQSIQWEQGWEGHIGRLAHYQ